ncbi:hypothetical protein EAH79_16945 [Sphingomonas koreensis]|nr:hypothetical protein EAH79_16945 [Sphingomonas koreensis]
MRTRRSKSDMMSGVKALRGRGRRGILLVTCLISAAYLSESPGRAVENPNLSNILEGLRQADIRVASVLYHLQKSNGQLCVKRGPLTGLVMHSSNDYGESIRSEAVRHFDFESTVGIEGIVPSSPASVASIEPDDSVLAVDGAKLPGDATPRSVIGMIGRDSALGPIVFQLRHSGGVRSVAVRPVTGCVARVEVDVSDDLNAATDGDTIQIDSALVNLVGGDDQALAAILAHELAHIVLDHPARLTAAHVNRGMFKGFGRSARLFKQTEKEADRLSVTLMANAGYDPAAAERYWRTYGAQLNDHGGFGSTHLAWQKRADLIAAEVARVAKEKQRPIIPDWLSSRDQPLR